LGRNATTGIAWLSCGSATFGVGVIGALTESGACLAGASALAVAVGATEAASGAGEAGLPEGAG
jgi:hypothetical protein